MIQVGTTETTVLFCQIEVKKKVLQKNCLIALCATGIVCILEVNCNVGGSRKFSILRMEFLDV
jgi:hypothetical protein